MLLNFFTKIATFPTTSRTKKLLEYIVLESYLQLPIALRRHFWTCGPAVPLWLLVGTPTRHLPLTGRPDRGSCCLRHNPQYHSPTSRYDEFETKNKDGGDYDEVHHTNSGCCFNQQPQAHAVAIANDTSGYSIVVVGLSLMDQPIIPSETIIRVFSWKMFDCIHQYCHVYGGIAVRYVVHGRSGASILYHIIDQQRIQRP